MLIGLEAEVMAGIIAKKIVNAYNSKLEAEVKIALDSIKCLVTESESETEVLNILRNKYNMRLVFKKVHDSATTHTYIALEYKDLAFRIE
jgi:hypothetical protein